MAVLKISDEQVLELVLQLTDQQRNWLFTQLAARQWQSWAELSRHGVQQVKSLAEERGLDWNRMSDAEREQFVDQILHE